MQKFFSLDNRAWSASFVNILAMALQFWTLLTTRNVGGISLGMLAIFLYVQITFAQVGRRDKSWALFWGMAISAVITTTIILFVIYVRFFSHLHQ
jgi:hypothetical protein